MRTTIELTEDQRAALLHLAARRGMKGFSQIVKEALDRYLDEQEARQGRIDAAVDLRGALAGSPGDDLEERAREIRARWR